MFFVKSVHCAFIGTVQRFMGEGSDMQGTPPRDLRVFRNINASAYAAIYMYTVQECVCVFVFRLLQRI